MNTSPVPRRVIVIVCRQSGVDTAYLLLLRAKDNLWQPVAGKVEDIDHIYDNPSQAAALRELDEETGIRDGKPMAVLGEVDRDRTDGRPTKRHAAIFLRQVDDDQLITLTEHVNYKWAGYDEAFEALKHSTRFAEALRRAAATLQPA